jgi:hypothetical protein
VSSFLFYWENINRSERNRREYAKNKSEERKKNER